MGKLVNPRIWVGLSFDDEVLILQSRETARKYNASLVRFVTGFCETKEFKSVIKTADESKEKIAVTFTGHAGTNSYGEHSLSPAAFHKKLQDEKLPFSKIDTIDLYGCMIGLGDKSYLYRFAEELYQNPNNRHIKVRGLTSWGVAPNEDLAQMFVRATHEYVSVGGIRRANNGAYLNDLAKYPLTHRITEFYASKHEEVLYENKLGFSETLDKNPNFTLTYDKMKKIKSFGVQRLKIWVEFNNRLGDCLNPKESQMVASVIDALEDEKQNIIDIQERFPLVFLKKVKEKKNLPKEFTKSPSYYLKIAIDYNLVDEIKCFNPDTILDDRSVSKNALLYAMEKKSEIAVLLVENGANIFQEGAGEMPLKAALKSNPELATKMLSKISNNPNNEWDHIRRGLMALSIDSKQSPLEFAMAMKNSELRYVVMLSGWNLPEKDAEAKLIIKNAGEMRLSTELKSNPERATKMLLKILNNTNTDWGDIRRELMALSIDSKQSPLQFAMAMKNPELLRVVMRSGLDLSEKNAEGNFVIAGVTVIGMEKLFDACLSELIYHIPKNLLPKPVSEAVFSPLCFFANNYLCNINMLVKFLLAGFDVNAKASSGVTILHLCFIGSAKIEAARALLLHRRLDLNVMISGKTLLDQVSAIEDFKEKAECVALLEKEKRRLLMPRAFSFLKEEKKDAALELKQSFMDVQLHEIRSNLFAKVCQSESKEEQQALARDAAVFGYDFFSANIPTTVQTTGEKLVQSLEKFNTQFTPDYIIESFIKKLDIPGDAKQVEQHAQQFFAAIKMSVDMKKVFMLEKANSSNFRKLNIDYLHNQFLDHLSKTGYFDERKSHLYVLPSDIGPNSSKTEKQSHSGQVVTAKQEPVEQKQTVIAKQEPVQQKQAVPAKQEPVQQKQAVIAIQEFTEQKQVIEQELVVEQEFIEQTQIVTEIQEPTEQRQELVLEQELIEQTQTFMGTQEPTKQEPAPVAEQEPTGEEQEDLEFQQLLYRPKRW